MNSTACQLDRARIRGAFHRAAESYDAAAALQRAVGRQLLRRLESQRLQPSRVLDLGAGTGVGSRALAARYPLAEVTALDLAPGMLHWAREQAPAHPRLRYVCADAGALPFPSGSFDLVFSNMMLQWCEDLERVLTAVRRVLRPGGALLFTTLGPETLNELRRSWAAADGHVHVNRFAEASQVEEALAAAGFEPATLERERRLLGYQDVTTLMRELKAIGAHNVNAGRARGLTGRRRLRAMTEAYEGFRDAQGRLPATYELFYGCALAPAVNERTVDAAGDLAERF